MSSTLFDVGTGFVLWFRPDRGRSGWESVATCPTEFEAVRLIGTGGRHNGDWLILPVGQQP